MAGDAPSAAAARGWLYHPQFPADWARQSLYSLAEWVNGLAFRDIQFSTTGMPVIKIAEIKAGISGQTKFTQQTFDESIRIKSGDLLFSWSGQPETSIDAFWWQGPEGWLNQHVFRVTPSAGIDRIFFYYLLRYLRPNFVGIVRNKQTTGLGHVTKRDLENIEAAYPGIPEQRAIAHILGTLEDKIDLNRRMNETLEAIARALFKSWFVDFDPVRTRAAGRDPGLPKDIAVLFPDAFQDSELGETPKGWRVVPLPELIEVNPPRSLRKGQVAPYLDMANMPTSGHRPVDWVERPFGSGMRFVNGDTLLARITPCLENGKTAFVDFLHDGEVGWGSTEYIVLHPKTPLPPAFGYFLARDEEFRSFAIQNMSGTSGRQRVPADCFVQFKLAVLTEALVQCFRSVVEPLMIRIKANSEQSHTLAALRDTLLPKLLSGEIRLKDAEEFVESRL